MPTDEDESARVQLSGLLCKRPVNVTTQQGGLLAHKFYRRFFVVKDGFLLYYPESEKREFDKRKCANYHPKGIMPLGDCTIQSISEPEYPYMIAIINELSQERLVLLCETSWDQEKWLDVLERSARISWKNAQLGDSLIQQLRLQGDRLAHEKQEAVNKLYEEVKALSEEKEKTVEMERLVEEMEEEKRKLEAVSNDLQNQYRIASSELQVTAQSLHEVEAEREKLALQQKRLATTLESLEEQKVEMEEKLTLSQQKSTELKSTNLDLSTESEQMKAELEEQMRTERQVKSELESNLTHIENEMKRILADKESAEHRVEEQCELAKLLNEEKAIFHEETKELQKSLTDIKHQKQMTEAELQEEIKARIRAEERLHAAEKALTNLEQRLTDAQSVPDDQRQQMMVNVKALKKYFEEKVIEHKIQADMPIIMKRAVYNKRRNMRAKSVRIIRDQNFSVANSDVNQDSSALNGDVLTTARMRNSAGLILKNKELRAEISKTVHYEFTA